MHMGTTVRHRRFVMYARPLSYKFLDDDDDNNIAFCPKQVRVD
jgi:hypothetical protein